MTLARALPEDLGTLLAMCRRYCELDGHVFDEPTARSGFAPLLDGDCHGVVWLICDDGPDPAGYAVVTWGWSIESGGPDALLDEIYVDRRGRGLGSAAVVEIIEDCRRRGFIRVFLETERHNLGARRLYSRFGFREEDSVWMSKDL